MTAFARHIEVDGGHNVRDLGGYPTEDGRVTRWHTLVRSGSLDRMTPAGEQTLVDYGITTIIDLRDATEVRQHPDTCADSAVMRYRHLPLSPEGFAVRAEYARLDGLYAQYLSECGANIGAIIAAVAESAPGILFHCHVGKDRTGMIAALLLGAVGVPDGVIAEDYALTSRRITALVAEWRGYAEQNGHDLRKFERDAASDAAIMLDALGALRKQYGSITDYLRACGVTDSQLARLDVLLIEQGDRT